jgi:DNA-binding CsgD family transcriptional regulator
MSVMPEQQLRLTPEPVREEDQALVFAAASIVREMARYRSSRPVREVVSNNLCYRLEGHRLPNSPEATGPIVLVFVDAATEQLPNDDVLRRSFGLTRKEACVARLIADARTNDEIADELCISPHTARHHTERILAKLGAKSRTKVRNALVNSVSSLVGG